MGPVSGVRCRRSVARPCDPSHAYTHVDAMRATRMPPLHQNATSLRPARHAHAIRPTPISRPCDPCHARTRASTRCGTFGGIREGKPSLDSPAKCAPRISRVPLDDARRVRRRRRLARSGPVRPRSHLVPFWWFPYTLVPALQSSGRRAERSSSEHGLPRRRAHGTTFHPFWPRTEAWCRIPAAETARPTLRIASLLTGSCDLRSHTRQRL
jgi:hypothetical protein